MTKLRAGSEFVLVRRTLDSQGLREFAHPPSGPPVERGLQGGQESESTGPSLLVDGGPDSGPPRRGQLIGRMVRPEDAVLPLHVPMLRSACDGEGACCSLYHHIPVVPLEAERILGFARQLSDLPLPAEELLYPAYEGLASGPLNVVSVGGSCAFFAPSSGQCRLHEEFGSLAKPQRCLAFPAHLVLCGDEWHASLLPECACMARNAIEGAALEANLDAWVALRSTMKTVWTVPESIAVDPALRVERGRYVEWMRETVAALKTSFQPVEAVIRAGCQLRGESVAEVGPPSRQWLVQTAEWLADYEKMYRPCHPEGSPFRSALSWGRRCVEALAEGHSADPDWSRGKEGDWARRAASVAALLVHGHGLLEYPLLGPAVDELARYLWLGRASQAVGLAEAVEPRLESTTTWLFLWHNVQPGDEAGNVVVPGAPSSP